MKQIDKILDDLTRSIDGKMVIEETWSKNDAEALCLTISCSQGGIATVYGKEINSLKLKALAHIIQTDSWLSEKVFKSRKQLNLEKLIFEPVEKEEELLPCIFCEKNTMIIDGTCNGSFWAICPTCYYITPSQYCKHQLCMEKTCLNESKIRAVMNHNELYRKLHPEQKNQIGQTEIAEKLKYAAHNWHRYAFIS
jgi:hypothetical protein